MGEYNIGASDILDAAKKGVKVNEKAMICNHVWGIEILPNFSLEERVETVNRLNKEEFVWLREGEDPEGYELCQQCKRAVRKKGDNHG